MKTTQDQPYMREMETYIEEISDDFNGTWLAVAPNIIQNMMGQTGDVEADKKLMLDIVNKYIPNSKLEFLKRGWFSGEYDLYTVIRTDE